MINEIYELLIKKEFKAIIKMCVKNRIEETILNEAVIKIDKQLIDDIENDYMSFMNAESNVFSKKDKDLYGTDSIEIRNTLGELYKTVLGAMLVKHFAEHQ